MIVAIEAKEGFSPNLLDALYLIRLSWDNVSPQTIKNCFDHCGFKQQDADCDNVAGTSTCVSETASETQLLDQLRTEGVELSDDITFESFVNVDTEVVTTAELSETDIVAPVQRGGGDTESDDTNELLMIHQSHLHLLM